MYLGEPWCSEMFIVREHGTSFLVLRPLFSFLPKIYGLWWYVAPLYMQPGAYPRGCFLVSNTPFWLCFLFFVFLFVCLSVCCCCFGFFCSLAGQRGQTNTPTLSIRNWHHLFEEDKQTLFQGWHSITACIQIWNAPIKKTSCIRPCMQQRWNGFDV